MIKAYSLNTLSSDYAARVLKTMDENYGYIVFFNKFNVKEAYQRIFAAAMKSENRSYVDLTPYIKALARNVMKSQSKEIPYAPFDEEGEVAYIFTRLTENTDPLSFADKEIVESALQDIYLMHTEDFLQLRHMIPCSEAKDVTHVIKNEALKDAVLNLARQYGGNLVFYTICEFLDSMAKDKECQRTHKTTERVLTLKDTDYSTLDLISAKKWLLDTRDEPVGINPVTLYMDNNFNPDFNIFRLAIKTASQIWRVDFSDFLNMVETNVHVAQGVDTPYISWCKDKYKLTTPGGQSFLSYTREKFMELVRQEVILALVESDIGEVIAVSPDSAFIKLTRSATIGIIRLKSCDGKIHTLEMELQPVELLAR